MSFNFRLPNITDSTPDGKLQQLQRYMYQLVQDLNWALNSLEQSSAPEAKSAGTVESAKEQNSPVDSFNSIKSLIIKSADIVQAYYDAITTLIDQNGLYAAKSDFGKFVEKTNNTLYADDKGVTQQLQSIQKIFDENGNIRAEVMVNGNIYSGILEYAKNGEAIVGLEIGQTTDGFHRFARFTAEKLSFYDGNGNESAYVSNKKLNIPHANITVTLTMGGFQSEVLWDKSVVERWVGG